MVGPHDQMLDHADTLMTEYAGQIEAHAFEAVLEQGSNQVLSILEIFGAGINKWHGIKVACDRLGADPSRVVFIGDQINDLPALNNVSLGIAPKRLRVWCSKKPTSRTQWRSQSSD